MVMAAADEGTQSTTYSPEPESEPPTGLAAQEIDDGWRQLSRLLDRVPFVAGLKRDVSRLRRLVGSRRPMRIAAFGSYGSGRSRLAGALLGGPALREGVRRPRGWVRVDGAGRTLEWLELAPDEEAPAGDVDAYVLVVTPAEVEAGLGALIEGFTGYVGRTSKGEPKLFAVLSKCDELSPESAAWPFPDEKVERIELIRQRFARQLREAGLNLKPYAVAIASPEDQRLGIEPWGLGELPEEFAKAAPDEAAVEAARALQAPIAQSRVANEIIQACSTLSLTVALAPVPFSDIALLAPIQGMMVSSVAYLSGREWGSQTAMEGLASVGLVGGLGFGFRLVARQAAKLVPGAGSIVAGSIAGAGTLALGRSAKRYFLDGQGRK